MALERELGAIVSLGTCLLQLLLKPCYRLVLALELFVLRLHLLSQLSDLARANLVGCLRQRVLLLLGDVALATLKLVYLLVQ